MKLKNQFNLSAIKIMPVPEANPRWLIMRAYVTNMLHSNQRDECCKCCQVVEKQKIRLPSSLWRVQTVAMATRWQPSWHRMHIIILDLVKCLYFVCLFVPDDLFLNQSSQNCIFKIFTLTSDNHHHQIELTRLSSLSQALDVDARRCTISIMNEVSLAGFGLRQKLLVCLLLRNPMHHLLCRYIAEQ